MNILIAAYAAVTTWANRKEIARFEAQVTAGYQWAWAEYEKNRATCDEIERQLDCLDPTEQPQMMGFCKGANEAMTEIMENEVLAEQSMRDMDVIYHLNMDSYH